MLGNIQVMKDTLKTIEIKPVLKSISFIVGTFEFILSRKLVTENVCVTKFKVNVGRNMLLGSDECSVIIKIT